MGEFVLKDVRILYGGADLSGDMNEVTVTRSADMLDKTVFGSSAKRRQAGLKDFQVTGGGFYNAASTKKNDPHLFNKMGSTGNALLVAQNSSLGAICYAADNVLSQMAPGGRIGEMMKFNFACYADGDAVRGQLMEAGTGLSTALAATVRNLGAVGSTQRLYAIGQINAVSSSGGTHTVRPVVESDNTTDFSGSPSTVMQLNAVDWSTRMVSGEIKSTDLGGSTDEYFRFQFLSTGSTNSKITGFFALAIQ